MSSWGDKFEIWARPPAASEEERISNAENAIKKTISESDDLKHRDIRVFTIGSYKNNTNVRKDSDVDIAVVCRDSFFHTYPDGMTAEDFGHVDGHYRYATFKNEVGEALVKRFGSMAVVRGNKAFDVHENSYRVEADVVPFFEHRRYNMRGRYDEGVELRPDNGKPFRVINWPQQHYTNGVGKNTSTSRRYKSVVRIIKCLSNEMAAAGVAIAADTPGFLVECLVWNVPNDHFGKLSLTSDVRSCLAFLFNYTRADDNCSEWGEVSELKYLFRPGSNWTRAQAHSFINAAWIYLGFED